MKPTPAVQKRVGPAKRLLKKYMILLKKNRDLRRQISQTREQSEHHCTEADRRMKMMIAEVDQRVALEIKGYREYMQGRLDERDAMINRALQAKAETPFAKALIGSRPTRTDWNTKK